MRLLLVDKSAYVRGPFLLGDDDEQCVCAATRLEMLFSARGRADYETLDTELSAFRDLRMDATTFAIAIAAHRDLAKASQHRIPLPDLLIAACAQQHGADVVHVDRHFDVLSQVLGFASRRPEDVAS